MRTKMSAYQERGHPERRHWALSEGMRTVLGRGGGGVHGARRPAGCGERGEAECSPVGIIYLTSQ